MTVGILRTVLFIQESNSLKEKRMVLHSLKARLRNNFNVSVAQIEDQDKWQKTTLAIVGVDRNRNNMHSTLSHIVNFLERHGEINILNYEMEMI